MKTSQAWVELALKTLSCTQAQLAEHIGVSPTQITLWRKGEHMASDRETRFRKLLKAGDRLQPEVILWAGSIADARRWEQVIAYLAEAADDYAETGYDTEDLTDPLGLLGYNTILVLTEMGVARPTQFPPELAPFFSGRGKVTITSIPDTVPIHDLLRDNPYTSVIRRIFDALTDVSGFCSAYLDETLYALPDEHDALGHDVQDSLLELAASKIDVDETFAPRFREFRHRVRQDFLKWLPAIKAAAYEARLPLRAELLDLLADDADTIGHAAEREALGFNADQVHPDIYMNELLVGMRTLYQILPAILKKLDIKTSDTQEG
jgi:transcriptional regulator with XRE-family HTH domain